LFEDPPAGPFVCHVASPHRPLALPESSAMSEPRITHTSTVTEDQIDHLGHMNVQYYAVNARAGTDSLLASLGADRPMDPDVFDVYTRHHREQLVGADLAVRSGVLGVDTESIRIYHELVNVTTGDLAASFVHRVRSAVPVDLLETIEMPSRGAPRSIDLDSVAVTPPLETLEHLGLAMRAPRTLGPDDTAGSTVVPTHLVPWLIWGGTPADGSERELIQSGPSGERVGWATMEMRIGIVKLPGLGTRIQSFGATTAIADKTTQMSMWAYDVDTGDPLVTFELVSLLFDLGSRRAISIPEALRAEHHANLRPELGAG
jgi:acyl-CoA thioesterase FadM